MPYGIFVPGATRPVPGFKVCGGKIHFYRGRIVGFIICLKQIFLDTTQIGDTKTLGRHFPRMPPMVTGLGATLSICAFVVFIPVWKYLGNRPTALFQITSKLPQYG